MKRYRIFLCFVGLGLVTIASAVAGAASGDVIPPKAVGTKAPSNEAKPESAKDDTTQKATSEDTAAAEETARRATKVAVINGQAITLADLEDALASQPPMFRQEYASKEKQMELIESLIQGKLLAEEAKRRGFDKDPEVTAIAKNKLASLMHRNLVESADGLNPAEEDLKKYYDAHLSDYHKPEKVRARHMLIKDKATAEAKLKALLAKKVELHEFRKMAKELTEDEATQKNGGDLGFFTRPAEREEGDPEVLPALVEAAFSLKKNADIYPKLIESEAGFHILMRTGYRSKLDIPFEESKDRLEVLVRRDLRKDTVEAGIEKLKQQFPVEVVEENLKHVVIDLSEDTTGGTGSVPSGGAD